jgi:hypothetical protein
LQLESVGIEGRSSIIGERTSHGQTVSAHRLGFFISPSLQCPLKWTYPTHLFLQLFLDMSVGIGDRLGGFAQVMEMTELMRNPWQGTRDPRLAQRDVTGRQPA